MSSDRVVGFRRATVDLVDGDINTALMLCQIGWYYQPTKDGTRANKLNSRRYGKWWLAKSHVDWKAELGLTQDQSRRCLAVLKARGIITTRRMLYQGQQMLHLALVQLPTVIEALGLDAPQVASEPHPCGVEPTSYKEKKDKTRSRSSTKPVPAAQDKHGQDKPTQGQTGQINPKVKGHPKVNPAPAGSLTPPPLAPPPSPEDEYMASVADALSKYTPEDADMFSVADALSKYTPKNAGKLAPSAGDKWSTITTVWKAIMASHYPSFDGSTTLNTVDAAKLKLVYNKLGPDTAPVVAWAITHWTGFTIAVKKLRGESIAPIIPVPGYLLVHAHVACALYHGKALPVDLVEPVQPIPTYSITGYSVMHGDEPEFEDTPEELQ